MPSPTADRLEQRLHVVRGGQQLQGRGVPGQLRHQRPGERAQRPGSRCRDDGSPPGRDHRQQAGSQKRALAGSRRTDQSQQVRPLELSPHLFDLQLAAEEILGVVLGEGGQAGIGLEILGPRHPQHHLFEGAGQRGGRAVPTLLLAGHGLAQQRGPGGVGNPWRLVMDSPPDLLTRLEGAQPPGGDHLGQHHAGGEDVGAGIQCLAPGLLRGHVRRGSRDRARFALRQTLGDAEVHQHHPTRAGDHDVLRLDVPVHQAGLVDRFQAGQELRGDLPGLRELQRGPHPEDVQERDAVDVLHRHQLLAVELHQVEDPADVRRDHLAGGADLLAQRLQSARVLEQLWPQRLQRHVDAQLEIGGPPDLAHPAAAQKRANAVALAQDLAGRERLV